MRGSSCKPAGPSELRSVWRGCGRRERGLKLKASKTCTRVFLLPLRSSASHSVNDTPNSTLSSTPGHASGHREPPLPARASPFRITQLCNRHASAASPASPRTRKGLHEVKDAIFGMARRRGVVGSRRLEGSRWDRRCGCSSRWEVSGVAVVLKDGIGMGSGRWRLLEKRSWCGGEAEKAARGPYLLLHTRSPPSFELPDLFCCSGLQPERPHTNSTNDRNPAGGLTRLSSSPPPPQPSSSSPASPTPRAKPSPQPRPPPQPSPSHSLPPSPSPPHPGPLSQALQQPTPLLFLSALPPPSSSEETRLAIQKSSCRVGMIVSGTWSTRIGRVRGEGEGSR